MAKEVWIDMEILAVMKVENSDETGVHSHILVADSDVAKLKDGTVSVYDSLADLPGKMKKDGLSIYAWAGQPTAGGRMDGTILDPEELEPIDPGPKVVK